MIRNEPTIADSGIALGETVAANGALDQTLDAARSGTIASTTRTTMKATVLPKFADNSVVHEERIRYEVKSVLGEGGMGEVALAIDHDIGRSIALKHLHNETSRDAASLARFVDEIRIVGALEHPNIVPIHDVGVGEDGRYFFVMKHVEGETLEAIIEKLQAGDETAKATYTFTTRIEIMIGLLRALDYAHSRGIVHRDIKPANVMIGKYGEVVLMDWGISKPKRTPEPAVSAARPNNDIAANDSRARMFTTRHGSLVGTPAYMSPEQASGQNAAIDERSDLYSAAVLFHEFLSLRHYLNEETTLEGLIRAVIHDTKPIVNFGFNRHPKQSMPPAELMHFCENGLRKKPEERFQSAREMIQRLEETLDGKVHVECPFTMTKRMTREYGRFVDRFPILAVAVFFSLIALVIFSLFTTIRALV